MADNALASVQTALFSALPGLPPNEMVDMLEFIATQHAGSFNPDNTDKALEIAAFVQQRPFAVSARGVGSLARLARHALGSSTGQGNSAEHQLWLLTSGALNTAAAIREHDGDAVRFFNAVKRDGLVRGKYMQREFAKAAMADHLSKPHAFNNGAPPPAEPPTSEATAVAAASSAAAAAEDETPRPLLSFLQIWLSAMVVFLAIVAGIITTHSDSPSPLADAYAQLHLVMTKQVPAVLFGK